MFFLLAFLSIIISHLTIQSTSTQADKLLITTQNKSIVIINTRTATQIGEWKNLIFTVKKMIHLNWSYQGGVGRSSNSVVGEREMLPKDIQSIANFAGLGDKQSNK